MGKILRLVEAAEIKVTAEDVYDLFVQLTPAEVSHFVYMLSEQEADGLKQELDKYYPDESEF